MCTTGDIVFLIQSGNFIKKCTVISDDGQFCTIRFQEGGAIRIRHSRLYNNEETAREQVEKIHKMRGDTISYRSRW